MRYLLIIACIFFAFPVLADVIVVDQNGLTRAAKRGVKSANVTVNFTAKPPQSLKLKSVDGSNQNLNAEISSGQAVLTKVPAGTWQVQGSGSSYKVQIK